MSSIDVREDYPNYPIGHLPPHPNYKTLKYAAIYGTSNNKIEFGLNGKYSARKYNLEGVGGTFTYGPNDGLAAFHNAYVTDIDNTEPSLTTKWVMRNSPFTGTTQEWAEITNYHDNHQLYYIVDIFSGLETGHTYYMEAQVINTQVNAAMTNTSYSYIRNESNPSPVSNTLLTDSGIGQGLNVVLNHDFQTYTQQPIASELIINGQFKD